MLVHLKVRFPYVHDLTELLSLIAVTGRPVPKKIKEAGRLTRFAVASRYPGLEEPVTSKEYKKAVAIAESVLHWAEERVREKP